MIQNKNKALIIIISGGVIILAVIIAVSVSRIPRPGKSVGTKKSLTELMRRMDELAKAVEEKSGFNIIDKEKGYEISPEEEINLCGILWHPDKPLAVVNERVVGVDDYIGSLRVITITQHSIQLVDKDGRIKTFELKSDEDE